MTLPARSAQLLRWSLLRAPGADPKARAHALGALSMAGGLLGLLSLTTGAGREVWDLVDAVMVGATLTFGYGLIAVGHRLSARWFPAIVAVLTVAVAVVQWQDGPVIGPFSYALLYIWIALYVGYFFSTAVAAALVALGVVSQGIVLSTFPGDHQFELLVLAASTLVVAGVTNWLSHRSALSQLDALTGVANRRGLDVTLQAAMSDSVSSDAPLAVGLIDLDDFRSYNEARGHDAGDQLLAACVAGWRDLLPRGVTLARYDSDSFVVVAPGVGVRDVRELVERLRAAVPPPQTCSVGVAGWVAGDTQSMLIGRAETALYEAKLAGRNRVHVVGGASELAAELVAAIDAGEMRLHYQPIYSLSDGRLEGVEALARWFHPVRGLIPPADFIPVAEQTAAIHALGEWVIDTACEQLNRWRRSLPAGGDLTLAINVSPAQLQYPGLVDALTLALTTYDLPPCAIEIEITESALAHDRVEMYDIVAELHQLGVRLAMDDFGTGYSSLARLRLLPFDILKIDRSFVAMLGNGGNPLFEAIVGLARSLGLDTVAEGIEEVPQLRFATAYGCSRGQGFLLCPPLPVDAIDEVLRATAPSVLSERIAASG